MILSLSQGEILLILVHRCGRKAQEVAEGLSLSQYTYLSRLYKREKLPDKIIRSASSFFNMPETIFETSSLAELSEKMDALEGRVKILESDKVLLEAKVCNLSARLEECERKKGLLESRQN